MGDLQPDGDIDPLASSSRPSDCLGRRRPSTCLRLGADVGNLWTNVGSRRYLPLRARGGRQAAPLGNRPFVHSFVNGRHRSQRSGGQRRLPWPANWRSQPIAVLYVARFGARQRRTSATTTPPGEDTINVGALLARGSSCKPAALNAASGVIFGAATRGDHLDDKELTCATRTISLKAWRSMRRGG